MALMSDQLRCLCSRYDINEAARLLWCQLVWSPLPLDVATHRHEIYIDQTQLLLHTQIVLHKWGKGSLHRIVLVHGANVGIIGELRRSDILRYCITDELQEGEGGGSPYVDYQTSTSPIQAALLGCLTSFAMRSL